MDKMRIQGGKKLQGSVLVSGAKNAALPILFASLLTDERMTFESIPTLHDIQTTKWILEYIGVECEWDKENKRFETIFSKLKTHEAPYDLVRKMRASVLALGPLLGRFQKARVSLPGGCAIGARPIQFHLDGLVKMGAKISIEDGYVVAETQKLQGAKYSLPFPSVGATENLLMAASLAKGETLLENCAREPEIVDLANALNKMGAKIQGAGTEKIQIQGVDSLHGTHHKIIADRIEAGTLLCACICAGGKIKLEGIEPEFLEAPILKLQEMGATIDTSQNSLEIQAPSRPKASDIITMVFPGFPTDLQAQFMTALCLADGTSVITEEIFENRFMHVPELCRLGADIQIRGKSAIIRGKKEIHGAQTMATDLRASASLILAGLAASGQTTVNRIYHLDRGYEKLEEKLKALGAEIWREPA